MPPGPIRCLAPLPLLLALALPAALADDPPAANVEAPRRAKPPTPGRAEDAPPPADPPPPTAAPAPPQAPPAAPAAKHEAVVATGETPQTAADPAAARAEVLKRIEKLEKAAAGDARDKPAHAKELREALDERLRRLDELAQAAAEHGAAEHPSPDPKVVAEQAKVDSERTQSMLEQSTKQPDALLPEAFRLPAEKVDDAALAAMKETIDAATAELGELATRAEALRPDPARKPTAAARAERDKAQQRRSALPGRRAERLAALSSATTDEARELARIRLDNLAWEDRAEAERLAELDARIALEGRRVDCDAAALRAAEARRELARRTLGRMRKRFQDLADRKRSDLQRAANAAQSEAGRSGDKLEQYRARRTAELLRLQARIVAEERSLTADTGPSADEQKRLAEGAVRDLDAIKKIVEDGRGGGLVALRLKNDYRRIMAERDLVAAGILPKAEDQLTRNENLLTEAELVLLNDSRDDHVELDSLLEALPPARHDAARRAFEQIEARHRELLARRCEVLSKLVDRDEDARRAIRRRIDVLDEQYAFIRTHLFWVRDAEPIGPSTPGLARAEARRLASAMLRLGLEAGDASRWRRNSWEFAVAAAFALILPFPFHRLRAHLGRRLRPGAAAAAIGR